MMNDTVLLDKGMQILLDSLGPVEAAHFVSLLKRENVDYTEWRRTRFEGMSLDDICREATQAKKEADERPK